MSALFVAALLSLPAAESGTTIAATMPVTAEATFDFAPAGEALAPAVGFAGANVAGVQLDRPTEISPGDQGYGTDELVRHTKSIPWRVGAATAAIAVTGVANWNWGSSSFRFNSEGWFGKGTASLGMDKLGHAWSSYVLTEFFTDGIELSGTDRRHAPISAAILAMGLMTGIEVFDGFSKDHGFSHEDLIVDAAGALFSVARRSIPGLRDKVDFRLLYTPGKSAFRSLGCFPEPFCDGEEGTNRSPITDYSHQRYLLAVKLAGFGRLKETPLRFVELHGGYYARGFTAEEEADGDPLRRRIFVGAGINLAQLLFPSRPGGVGRAIKSVLEYVQLPYTAVHTD